MATGDKLKDLNLSNDEVKRIGECLKDEKFRKLFIEYAEEISDPENRRRYEEEIQQMENERGMDAEFVHPKPGHVLKTSVDGNTKAFINICQNEKIDKPQAIPQVNPAGQKGINWQIPHSMTPPREDMDNSKKTCKVFDVVFNPDTYRMGQNPRFMKLVEDTAFDGIEKQFGVKLDKTNVVTLKKTKYKGMPVATVIRSKVGEKKKSDLKDIAEPLKNMPYPYSEKSSEEIAREMREKVQKQEKVKASKTKNTTEKDKTNDGIPEPKYSIIHRTNMDLQEYRNAPDARPSTRPKELVITIELPLLKSAKDVNLDIFEQKLLLESESPAKYKLDLKLPYPVDEENGGAKFDKSKHTLIVTLPVLPMKESDLPSPVPEASTESQREAEESTLAKESYEELSEANNIEPDEAFVDLPPLEDVEDEEMEENVKEEEERRDMLQQMYAIEYTFPEFYSSQDDSTVSFVINVKKVSHDSVTKTFPSPNSMCVKFYTMGSGGFPMHYCFHAQFPTGKNIVPDHCSIDVGDINLVVLVLKAKESRGLWNDFEAGQSLEHLQTFEFLTESNLARDLERLKEGPSPYEEALKDTERVNVTEMNTKKLTINITKKKSNGKKNKKGKGTPQNGSGDNSSQSDSKDEDEKEEDEDSVESLSSEIEVVHNKELPHLHGILKQRSVSESSEDLSSNCSPTSPREDLPGFKKSVSFNEKVDKTSFKSGAAVTTMTKALKSKRRRNRKREERKNGGRRRQNSGGSEGSTSGEEWEHKHSDHSQGEDSDHFQEDITEESEDQVGVQTNEVYKQGENFKMTGTKSEFVGDEKEGTGEEDSKKRLLKTISDKLSDDTGTVVHNDSDDDVDDGAEKIRTCANMEENSQKLVDDFRTSGDKILSEKEKNTSGMKIREKKVKVEEGTKVVSADGLKSNELIELIDEETSVVKVSADEVKAENDSGVECNADGSGDGHEKKDGSVLWKEPQVQGDEKNGNSNDITYMDHTTKCAFSFSNDVMFDLDVD